MKQTSVTCQQRVEPNWKIVLKFALKQNQIKYILDIALSQCDPLTGFLIVVVILHIIQGRHTAYEGHSTTRYNTFLYCGFGGIYSVCVTISLLVYLHLTGTSHLPNTAYNTALVGWWEVKFKSQVEY